MHVPGTSFPQGDFIPKVTRYDLYVTDTVLNYTGKDVPAIAVNGQTPMPTLHFMEGDTAMIVLHNKLKKGETSLHWHGLILPNVYDGVPWLTTPPIKAGESYTYKFALKQHGTYWYHSHTMLQEQSGMNGALIIHERRPDTIPEYVLLLTDWTDMRPSTVDRRLHAASDWFAIEKNKLRPGTVQSYSDAIRAGALGTKLGNEWKRMHAMDVSDVYYDRFLANGKVEEEAPRFNGGQQVRIRIVNGSASTYFWIQFAGGKMQVVASDGADVEPVSVDRFIMGIAETYDVIVTLPADSTAYELLATAEDRTRSTSLWLGRGIRQLAQPLGPLDYFAGMKMMNGMMKMNGDLDDMLHSPGSSGGMRMSLQQMDMNEVMYPEISGKNGEEVKKKKKKKGEPFGSAQGGEEKEHLDHGGHGASAMGADRPVTLNYAMLRAPEPTVLPPGPIKELHFELTGNMNRYLWTINNKTVSETDKIPINKGENVRLVLHNNSMMRHPMHLHGHFFRVLNGQGDHAPLKNVLDIMPMETDTIEFAGTEDGDWFFHCHILYHMMGGMGRVFSYADSIPNPALPDPKRAWRNFLKDDKHWHLMAENDFATNGLDGELMLMNKRWELQTEWRLGYTEEHGQEVEARFGRYVDRMQWLFPYIGAEWRSHPMDMDVSGDNLFGEPNTWDDRKALNIGLRYTLPFLFVIDGHIDTQGELRAQLMREDIALTPRLRMDLMGNSDLEYMAGLRYVLDKTWSIRTHYDSDMGGGVGITLAY
ncbi:MAG: multicopper oxidase domain-containing protein [Flavobacteriales bacterium]|nr:multicopper oxidase domain-containing protein [Flavobacteriales bacterium]